jgi:hypothetical protein
MDEYCDGKDKSCYVMLGQSYALVATPSCGEVMIAGLVCRWKSGIKQRKGIVTIFEAMLSEAMLRFG